jgi:hypothetical protein
MTASFTATFDLASVNQWVNHLQDDVRQALRPAAQAGADVLYQQVLANVPVGNRGHWFHGSSFRKNGRKYWFDAGTLKRAIYQAYATKESTDLRPVYSIGVNARKAPYAYMVELGTAKSPPVKYIGRARAQFPKALDAVQNTFFQRLKAFK